MGVSGTLKVGLNMNLDEFSTGPLEYNGEECPDAFYEGCMEKIFGTGNDIKKMTATEEGQALLAEFFKKIYAAIHNSIYDLIRWANHPINYSVRYKWMVGKGKPIPKHGQTLKTNSYMKK